MAVSTPAVQPLRSWASALRQARDVAVPDFDPADAGVDAEVLVLLEAPGPMAHGDGPRPGSGFVSNDNDDATAAAVWRARDLAGLHDRVLLWNIVPWYLGPASVKPTSREVADGAAELHHLLSLLPRLQAVLLAGRYAQRGWHRHISPVTANRFEVFETWHPSPQALNQPGKRDAFNATVAYVAERLREA